jgi:hypothetical protein
MAAKVTIPIPEWVDRIMAWPVIVYRKLKYGYSYRRIYLGEGMFTLVEQDDYYVLNRFRWHAEGDGKHIYAVRSVIRPRCRSTTMRMHREIMNAPAHLLVDHRNNYTLDNRRANLRLATYSQNRINCQRDKSRTSSKYNGVSLDKRNNKWRAYIAYNGKRIYLGRFETEKEAAMAYDQAAGKYHKEFARLNFPEA